MCSNNEVIMCTRGVKNGQNIAYILCTLLRTRFQVSFASDSLPQLKWKLQQACRNCPDEPIFRAGPNPLMTEFGIHHRLESCVVTISNKVDNVSRTEESSVCLRLYKCHIYMEIELALCNTSIPGYYPHTLPKSSCLFRAGKLLIPLKRHIINYLNQHQYIGANRKYRV